MRAGAVADVGRGTVVIIVCLDASRAWRCPPEITDKDAMSDKVSPMFGVGTDGDQT